jgi:porin
VPGAKATTGPDLGDRPARNKDAGGANSAAVEAQPASGKDDNGQAPAGGGDNAATAPGPEAGVKFSLQEQSEAWANLAGGGKTGTSYNGLTTAILDVDLEKLVDLKKGRLYISAFDIHGHGPTRSLVGNNQIVSNIEATPSLKLYDLWVEERFFGKLYVRAGQEGANDEMMTTAYGALFLNSSFGFPGLPAADLPSGGPNYPLATPFARVRWKATDNLTLVGAVYNGDPAPPGGGDPQLRDRNGTAFRINGHSLAFAEARYNPDPDTPDTLSTTYKLGVWRHSGPFADQRLDNAGGLLANPASTGIARTHTGDFAVYGIVDQVLWRREAAKDQGIALFLQAQGGPSDRNLANLFVESGFNWNAPFANRSDDVAGLAIAYLGISPAARRFSRDRIAFGGTNPAYAGNETIVEASYKAVVSEWLTLQPDAQYVINPSAGIPGVFNKAPLPHALIVGMRATVKFQAP